MAYNLINAFRARRRACEEVLDESLDLDQQVWTRSAIRGSNVFGQHASDATCMLYGR